MTKFQSKTSVVIITFFLFAIMISFALTGFDGFNSTQGAVASVDGEQITASEYQGAYNQELNRFTQMFGGKSLTNQQIRQFRIKENVIQRLVQQKLILGLAKNMKLSAGTAEVKDEIKKSPYFLTDKKFDVRKYRALLGQNNFSPAKYEEVVSNDIAQRKIFNLISSIGSSEGYAKDLLKFKNNNITAAAVEITKEDLTKYVQVTSAEIKAFTGDVKNKPILEGLFKSMSKEFNKEARVNARHILYKTGEGKKDADVLKKAQTTRSKLTRSNFKRIAGKETEDTSGQGSKGGDLGWFTKGRMVPEFEKAAFSMKPGQISKPIKTNYGYHIIYVQEVEKAVTKKLSQVQDKVAKSHLQKSNRKALNDLVESISKKLDTAFEKNDFNSARKLAKKYGFRFYPKAEANEFDLKFNGLSLTTEKVKSLFDAKSPMAKDETPVKISMAKVFTRTSPDKLMKSVEKSLKEEAQATSKAYTNSLQSEITKYLQDKAKVVTYSNIL
jgi:peptidyl-prolyl cis-trans isomerase D